MTDFCNQSADGRRDARSSTMPANLEKAQSPWTWILFFGILAPALFVALQHLADVEVGDRRSR